MKRCESKIKILHLIEGAKQAEELTVIIDVCLATEVLHQGLSYT